MYIHGELPIEVNVDVLNATTVAAMEEAERLTMLPPIRRQRYCIATAL